MTVTLEPPIEETECRKAFEKWMHVTDPNFTLKRWDDGGYMESTVETLWNGWEACCNTRVTTTPDSEAGENAFRIFMREMTGYNDRWEDHLTVQIYDTVSVYRKAFKKAIIAMGEPSLRPVIPSDSPAKTSWTCPDCCVNPCECKFMGDASTRNDEVAQEKIGSYHPSPIHDSDCALHNEPAYPSGTCDCSVSRSEIPDTTTLNGWLKAHISLPIKDEYHRGWNNAMEACLMYVGSPEPVSGSVLLEKCEIAHAKASADCAMGLLTRGQDETKYIVKAVLDAAGAKYVD